MTRVTGASPRAAPAGGCLLWQSLAGIPSRRHAPPLDRDRPPPGRGRRSAQGIDSQILTVLDTVGMRTRMSRVEQVERNRALVLAAARRVFLGRGYAGASLEAIAEEAGFSKGVVYSQFDSKADLFLELLAARIAERAEQHERLALELGDARLVQAVAEQTDSIHQAEPQWSLLVIEFRAHAARVPELNRRYAELHAHTIDRLAGVFGR